jgi:hypothetical protein
MPMPNLDRPDVVHLNEDPNPSTAAAFPSVGGSGLGAWGKAKAQENLANPPDAPNLPANVPEGRRVGAPTSVAPNPLGDVARAESLRAAAPQRPLPAMAPAEPEAGPMSQQFNPHQAQVNKLGERARRNDMISKLRGPGGLQHVMAFAYGVHKDPVAYQAHINPMGHAKRQVAQYNQAQTQARRAAQITQRSPKSSSRPQISEVPSEQLAAALRGRRSV